MYLLMGRCHQQRWHHDAGLPRAEALVTRPGGDSDLPGAIRLHLAHMQSSDPCEKASVSRVSRVF